ncbi:MAG: phosphohydrolase [Chloroflexi bacterium]|nr:phosphohydrolase [Chloroflexota bacterium]
MGIVDQLVKTPGIRGHLIANEAFMRALARRFGEDEEEWGLVGLLHDADYEATEKDLERHTELICEMIAPLGAGERIMHGIKAHGLKVPLESRLDKAMYACDGLCGLITACALVHPEKKIAPLTVPFVRKRFREKAFARSVNRAEILTCEENLGIPLDDFIEIGLESLRGVSAELGL